MRIDLVINRRAKRYAREPRLVDRIAGAASALARERCRVHATTTLAELEEVCVELAARGTDLVLFAGGDGSLMAGVTALARAFGSAPLPSVAPIPGGTVCTVARNWGLAGEPARTLERVLLGPRRVSRRPTLRVRELEPAAPRVRELEPAAARGHGGAALAERVGFMFGTGLVARFFELYYAGADPGLAHAGKLALRIFGESFVGGPVARRVLTPLPCTLSVDGEALPAPGWSLVCASVVRDLGLGFVVNHRAGVDPARPHLVASCLSPRRLGPRAPSVLFGRPIGGQGAVDRLAARFEVDFHEPRGAYVLDGELLYASRVTVTAGPLLDVVTPA